MKPKQKKRSKYNEHFDRIDATPEHLAEILMNAPPKKSSEWRFLNKSRPKPDAG